MTSSTQRTNHRPSPELWEWPDYFYPWGYLGTVRLRRIAAEFSGKVTFGVRSFLLELRGEAAPRDMLEQEWWLAALPQADADFAPSPSVGWPRTTQPVFCAVRAAMQQGAAVGSDFALRARDVVVAVGRNIDRHEVLLDIAREAALEARAFARDLADPAARAAVPVGVGGSWQC